MITPKQLANKRMAERVVKKSATPIVAKKWEDSKPKIIIKVKNNAPL